MNVITSNICPPIGIRSFDWMAYIEGDEEDGPTGYGETEVDALRHLCEQLAEEREPTIGEVLEVMRRRRAP